MKERLGGNYDPIRDPRLFPENIARRKMVRWREKDKRRKQKEKDKMREKTFKERIKKSIEEVGVELESTEEVEDSEEFVLLDNENRDLHKVSEEQKEMKKVLIEKAEKQSEKIGR
jgi:DNA-directed RNA polymerase specialized sigma24 family protein